MSTKKPLSSDEPVSDNGPTTGAQPRSADLPSPPESEDPRQLAEYFMDMLNALAGQASDEARRIRTALIDAVVAYRDNPDKAQARAMLSAHLAGLEAGVATLLVRNVRKMQQRFAQDLKRIGPGSPAGRALKTAADGFTTLGEALEKLGVAAERGDQALRAEAHALLAQAKSALEVLQR